MRLQWLPLAGKLDDVDDAVSLVELDRAVAQGEGDEHGQGEGGGDE